MRGESNGHEENVLEYGDEAEVEDLREKEGHQTRRCTHSKVRRMRTLKAQLGIMDLRLHAESARYLASLW